MSWRWQACNELAAHFAFNAICPGLAAVCCWLSIRVYHSLNSCTASCLERERELALIRSSLCLPMYVRAWLLIPERSPFVWLLHYLAETTSVPDDILYTHTHMPCRSSTPSFRSLYMSNLAPLIFRLLADYNSFGLPTVPSASSIYIIISNRCAPSQFQ